MRDPGAADRFHDGLRAAAVDAVQLLPVMARLDEPGEVHDGIDAVQMRQELLFGIARAEIEGDPADMGVRLGGARVPPRKRDHLVIGRAQPA